jgi:nucleoside-diphosphate-sugar epimerase
MKIFVTGGSGFLGARAIKRLVADGHEVFALARSEASDGKIRSMGATPVRGDLDRPETLSLPQIDAVVHAAAYFRFAGPRAPYFRTNVAGTAGILKAAERAGAKTFVYLSAGAVIMDNGGSPIRNADESAPTFPNSFSGYIASKARGEAAVLAANKPGFRTVAIRPPAIWGPGDAFSRELPRAINSGQFAFIKRGDYPYATCHVDNVLEAVDCALERGAGGQAYFIADREPTTFRNFVAAIAGANGLSIDKLRSFPYRLSFILGRMMELGAAVRFAKNDPPLSRTMVRMIGREFTTNDAAARRDLGYIGKTSRADGIAAYRDL